MGGRVGLKNKLFEKAGKLMGGLKGAAVLGKFLMRGEVAKKQLQVFYQR